jgi:multiple sugar transport system substrate-binding protein
MKKSRLSRRDFLQISAGAAVGTLLAACAPEVVKEEVVVKETVVVEGEEVEVTKVVEVEKVVTATPPPAEKPTIVYYDRHSDCEVWADAYHEYQDEVNVEVQIQPPDTRYEQLMAAITAGNAPDVIGLDCVQVGRFAQLGALAPLEDAIPQETLDLYFENLIATDHHYGIYGGHLVGVPFWVDNSVCFYNKAFLEEAGGDPEVGIQSWDDYITYGKAIADGDRVGLSMSNCGGCIDFLYTPWIWAQGGDFINADWTASMVLEDPTVEKMLRFTREIVNVHQITNDAAATGWTESMALFTSEKALCVHQGGGGVGLVRSEFPELFEVLGVCPIPGAEEGQVSSFIGGNVASMSTQSEYKGPALDFLIWVTASDEGIGVTGELGFLPGCPKGLELPVYTKYPDIYAAYNEALQFGYPSANDPRFDEAMSPWHDAVIAAELNEKPMEEILATFHEDVNRVLQRA